MDNLYNRVLDVGPGEQNSLVFYMSVKRESHGQMVGIFFSVDTALSVTADILLFQNVMLSISLSVSYGNSKDKLHTLSGSFGKKKPVGNTARPSVLFLMKFFTSSDSSFNERVEAGEVRNSDRRISSMPEDSVSTRSNLKRNKQSMIFTVLNDLDIPFLTMLFSDCMWII